MKWSIYNRSLVRRGKILIGFNVINNWNTDLKERNKYKVGSHFISNAFLLLLGYAKAYFHLPCGQTVELYKDMLKEISYIPDFTIINRRIIVGYQDKKTTDSKKVKDEYIIIAIDSTGIKVTNRGQWMQDKLDVSKNKKGYLKIHVY